MCFLLLFDCVVSSCFDVVVSFVCADLNGVFFMCLFCWGVFVRVLFLFVVVCDWPLLSLIVRVLLYVCLLWFVSMFFAL